ncbi:spore coat protein U domain-containing protein [Mesorhizobium sp. BR-1-1-10]|uniref:Csu type fimbrial protein n=1 Tax=Mesorhizobium sp. BR-1-1-10 TaxID=2876660 RepID=UPI001CD10D3F|nr:spore coat protein U domain-containing protein [Mesorhizobium sp. BR-1-1-10]MBZ9978058.1 spore coat U domain-containing protein [Mesorhizobium sp. BR-1-1-10]
MPMKIPEPILRILIAALVILLPAAAWAQSCSFGVSGMSFGQVDTLSGAQTSSTATMSVNCSGTPLARILICPNLGTGSGGATASARQMLSGSNILNYQLYSDSARSVVWGAYFWPYPARAPALALTLGVLGTGSGSATVYGAILGSQGTVPPGSYLSTFSSSHVEFRYLYTTSSSCGTGTGTIARPSFNVAATVAANCLVGTQDVDFGPKGVLSDNVDATGQVSVTCTPGTTYTVGLSNGLTGTAPTTRRMTLGTQAVTYGLYRDANRSQSWGNTVGTNTVAGTGGGTAQNLPVYGRVPPQATPSPGVYTDTVVVTVTY